MHEIFWEVSPPDDYLKDLYLYKNHSVYKHIWDANFDYDTQQTTAWMASIKLCDQVGFLKLVLGFLVW